jgi:hypothetical protein
MANFQPLTVSRHADKGWWRSPNYSFAASDTVAPLVAAELVKAASIVPIAFMSVGDDFVTVAVMGLEPGRNLLIGSDGRCSLSYIPAAYRGYPFQLLKTPEGGKMVLCFDEDSGLMSDGEGELFFDAGGRPAQTVTNVLNFLTQVHGSHLVTIQLCSLLRTHNLFQPWPITLQSGDKKYCFNGLHRIDETAFNALSPEVLVDLRNSGALNMVYCQLISIQHMPMLIKLAETQDTQVQLPLMPTGDLNLEFLNRNDTFNFSKLGF